jgi:serine/threonine-protein kinase
LLAPGQIFASRYRVVRCIAEGGMGAIFEAEHTGTERRVALKLLFPHIMSVASARQKFELEAKISARVNNPFIVQVLDAGFDETSKSPYLVMELLAGQTLAARIRERGRLEVDEALRVLRQVAAGLDAAHGYREASGALKPIVHRDLKPENLFLASQHDGSTVAKILDFGIAKVLGDTGNTSQEVRGTPLYMAFEQVTAGQLSPQTDVWAFGLIAYHALTGAPYWRAALRADTNIQALFAEILSLPIEPPSVRLREHDTTLELPAAFDGWLLRCLDRTPASRFASAGVAVEALARAFERSPRQRSSRPVAAAATTAMETTHPAVPTPVVPKNSTAASLPAIASERRPSVARHQVLSSTQWAAVAAAGSFIVMGAIGWSLAGGEPEPPHTSAAPPASTAAVTPPPSKPAPAPAAPSEPRIRVAPIQEPVAPEPQQEPETASAQREPEAERPKAPAATPPVHNETPPIAKRVPPSDNGLRPVKPAAPVLEPLPPRPTPVAPAPAAPAPAAPAPAAAPPATPRKPSPSDAYKTR